jgi:hypothetical protein
LEDFAEFRSEENDMSYHANLPKIMQWIDHLGIKIHEFNLTKPQNSDFLDSSILGLETLRRMLRIDPQKRPSTRELKNAFPSNKCCDGGPEPYESELQKLVKAALGGNEKAVRMLLDDGVDIDAGDADGQTALHWAASNGHEAVVRLLLEKGADLTAKDILGWTALHVAARSGHEAVVRLLLENGADIATESESGWTALHLAASNGHEAVVRLLLEKGADVMGE